MHFLASGVLGVGWEEQYASLKVGGGDEESVWGGIAGLGAGLFFLLLLPIISRMNV